MSISHTQLICKHEWGISINWIQKCLKCRLTTNTPNFKELAELIRLKLTE